MNSLEWRVKKLETRILGQTAGLAHVDRLIGHGIDQDNVLDQLDQIAKAYKSFMDVSGEEYSRFNELYNKHKNLLTELDETPNCSDASKAELVLAYEDDLVKYMSAMKSLAEKADRVLNIEKWPDMSMYQERLNKLEQITKEQHLQSVKVDQRTEELIRIYNDIIASFKSNMVVWNEKLEAIENMEKHADEDE